MFLTKKKSRIAQGSLLVYTLAPAWITLHMSDNYSGRHCFVLIDCFNWSSVGTTKIVVVAVSVVGTRQMTKGPSVGGIHGLVIVSLFVE